MKNEQKNGREQKSRYVYRSDIFAKHPILTLNVQNDTSKSEPAKVKKKFFCSVVSMPPLRLGSDKQYPGFTFGVDVREGKKLFKKWFSVTDFFVHTQSFKYVLLIAVFDKCFLYLLVLFLTLKANQGIVCNFLIA